MENSVSHHDAVEPGVSPSRRRFGYLVPAVLFVALLILLGVGLTRDPRLVPSPLVGKSIPEFDLPPLPKRNDGLSNADLANKVEIVLKNPSFAASLGENAQARCASSFSPHVVAEATLAFYGEVIKRGSHRRKL